MSKYKYHMRVQANFNFDWNKVNYPSTNPRLMQYSKILWFGQDDEGWCIFKVNPLNNYVLRIDFYPPNSYY